MSNASKLTKPWDNCTVCNKSCDKVRYKVLIDDKVVYMCRSCMKKHQNN